MSKVSQKLREVLNEYIQNVNDSDNITETLGDIIADLESPATEQGTSPGPFGLLHLGRGSFGQAIDAAKQGQKVARSGWNGKKMFVAYSPGNDALPASGFWSPANKQFADENGGTAKVLPCLTMKTATDEILMGWLASQTDMLAEDWCIVN